ncbi:MAG: methyltransferase domain-containing protein [Proteobacteria bacterium]|nr:methyltransferase domain-containing protein [Pseudomonadota bacterium]
MDNGVAETPGRAAQIPQDQVAGLYNRLAWIYDIWAALTESKARARALALADIGDGDQVLEVAVGTGLAFAEVVRRNPSGRNVGIDLSPGMLGKAEGRMRRHGLGNFELSVGNALNIGEADASFDVLLNNYMFDLMARDHWPRVLGEYHRVLKPGGRLVMSGMTPGEGSGSGIYDRLYTLSPRLMGGCRGIHMTGPLEESGFSVLSRDYVQQMLFPSEIILAVKE